MPQSQVLFVAVDGLSRRTVASGLEMYGRDVITACDGAEALALLEANRDRIGVLVTDADMGGEIDGMAVAAAARRINPRIEVIYTSRAPHALAPNRKVKGAPSMRTPYHVHQLVSVISSLGSGLFAPA
jgi:CheY-like chemotaxis protein